MSQNTNIQDNLKLAIVQCDTIWEAPEKNRDVLANFFSSIEANTDLIILPEAFSTGFSMNAAEISETMNGATIQWLKNMAETYQLAICGSLFIEEDRKYYNRFVWVEANGNIISYDKRHLFSIGKENQHYSKGDEQVVITYKGWKIFPQICYDVRFPVWSRNTFEYDLLINVASWPAPRFKVWKTLLTARSIENQCYVAGVNRIGIDGNNVAHQGDSLVIDAKGNALLNAESKTGLMYCTISLSTLITFRTNFNTLNDRDLFNIEG